MYDDKGHFQSYDTEDKEENDHGLDFYDYDEAQPAGCQRGMEARFMLGGIAHSTAWADIPVNKAAFWVEPAAAATWNISGEGQPAAAVTSVQPILCRAVPVREVGSNGDIYRLFPVASIALAAVIVFLTILTLFLLCCSACAKGWTFRQQQKGRPSVMPLTSHWI